MMEEKIKIAEEIAKEIRHFEELYIHYKRLYLKVRFLCCSGETKRIKRNRDYYKEKLQETIKVFDLRAKTKLQCENV